ncbi:OmpA family protein [Hymenobacter humi]|uniref:OmpA family protein n=1 Tax=Hymenobacter humi TaxID=1411620 RepID=A0ABW2U7Q3_9BACT
MVAGRLKVAVHGHTDNTGDPQANQQLSEDRAMAVQRWLETKSRSAFPEGRVQVYAHGATEPVASNSTVEGKAKNRRVEIVLGN